MEAVMAGEAREGGGRGGRGGVGPRERGNTPGDTPGTPNRASAPPRGVAHRADGGGRGGWAMGWGGEGVSGGVDGEGLRWARPPHPDPLPRGEGMWSLHGETLSGASISPHPPIAIAMGPSLSRKGRGGWFGRPDGESPAFGLHRHAIADARLDRTIGRAQSNSVQIDASEKMRSYFVARRKISAAIATISSAARLLADASVLPRPSSIAVARATRLPTRPSAAAPP